MSSARIRKAPRGSRLFRTEAFRLAAIYAAVFAASVAALGGFMLVIVDEAFRDQIVQFSAADIAAIRKGYDTEGVNEAIEIINQSMAAPSGSDFFLLQRGAVRLAGNLPPMPPRTGRVALAGTGRDHDILGAGAFLAPGLYAFSGSDLYRVHATERRILQALLWLFGGVLVLAIGGGLLVSRTFLQRSDAMAKACRAIMDGDMKARIPLRGTQDEMDRLAATINEMLDRIARLMENLGQVTNDIAHDLRTPVSQLRQRLERVRDEAAGASGHAAALDVAIGKTDEILALFAAMLRIAQIEGGARRAAFARLEIAPLLEQMRDIFGPVAEAAGHDLSIADGAGTIRGDRALIVQMLSNLIENAIIHTPAGTHIAVIGETCDGRVTVTVRDDGPGVPDAEHEKLFRRLYRREASRSRPGYGLGLSLVAAIAELHGAAIMVANAVPHGLSIAVSFPEATDDQRADAAMQSR